MINPFQLNELDIKSFLKIVLAIQTAALGVICIDALGLEIPIIRQLIGFIYLTVIPGIIILRILKIHRLSNIETLLYTVGLSIAFLMFMGFFLNIFYPIIGILRPISILPLIITISAIILVLCIICYVREKDFSAPSFIDVRVIRSPPVLFLCLIPFLSIFGTYLVNFHHDNILLLFLIIILALLILLIVFDRFIPKNLYPLAIFIIAISLLYHRSLISMYLWGYDIHQEYYFANSVMKNSVWDPKLPNAYNAMLSIVMLAPIYSIISNMELAWVFKIMYPPLFSLVPLGLYRVFQKQTNDKIAFLSCFFFVSLDTFYVEMLALARQQIAELFLVLLILAMIDKNIDKIKRAFLFLVFSISLAVSHYGLSYIYMFCLISVWLLLVLAENPAIQRLGDNFHAKFSRNKEEKLAVDPKSSKIVDRNIGLNFVLLFVVFTLTWYMYVSTSSAFDAFVRVGDHIASSIFTEFLNPETAQGLSIIMGKTISPLRDVVKYLHLLLQFFIFVGVIALMFHKTEMKFEREYTVFSVINLLICFAGIAVPYFSSSLNTTRLYQITLIFLAPFCVIGGITVFKGISKLAKASWTEQHVSSSLKILSIFFAIFLLFNSGWVYEVAKDHPTSFSLNNTIDAPCFNEQEFLGAKWLSEAKSDNRIYADSHRWQLLTSFELKQVQSFPVEVDRIDKKSYIYFGSLNAKEGKVRLRLKSGVAKYTDAYKIVDDRNEIYVNGGSQIYC